MSIVCTCRLDFVHSEEFIQHRDAMVKMQKRRKKKEPHSVCCSRCRKPVLSKNANICSVGPRIYSVMCDDCLKFVLNRIENGGYDKPKK